MNIAAIVPLPLRQMLYVAYLLTSAAWVHGAAQLPTGTELGAANPVVVQGVSGEVGAATAKSTRGGNLIFGSRTTSISHPRLRDRPNFGVDFRSPEGAPMLTLRPNGDVLVRNQLVEHDPEARALTALVSWMWHSADEHRPSPGHYMVFKAGVGWPADDLTLGGDTIFNNASGEVLRISGGTFLFRKTSHDEIGLFDDLHVYGALLIWLDGVMPAAKLGAHGRELLGDVCPHSQFDRSPIGCPHP